YSPAESSLPNTATPLGMSGSSISECMIKKAAPSSHSKVVWPWYVVSGTRPCVPTVVHLPTNMPKGARAGFGIDASFVDFFAMCDLASFARRYPQRNSLLCSQCAHILLGSQSTAPQRPDRFRLS